MQSFREQSSYHGNQQSYPPDAHSASRLDEYTPRQQAQIFQTSFGGRRGGAGTPAIPQGESHSLQSYQPYRKESADFYYLSNKEGAPSGSQTQQRRSSGPVQSYGPPQGNNSSNSSTGFGGHYSREGHLNQFTGQHSVAGSLSQYSQDFTGSFSPGGGQYPSHVPNQQMRQQLYQSHQPLPQSANPSTSASTSHLQQMQRSASVSSPAGYPLRVGQFPQHYQPSAGSSSSFPNSQRFGQSGASYESYSPGGTSSTYESHIPGSSYGAQQAYGSYSNQHLKGFEASKLPHGGVPGQQQQQLPNVMQYSNTTKIPMQNTAGQYSQSEVPVRSPMQFQQNFSPISNPSPAASVVQSPSCSSTPSPLMTSGESLQCGQGNVPLPSRNRILQMIPQLSPNPQAGGFKGFGAEGPSDKRLVDPGLSSLSALSSQVANLPNTVQHMLLSDALAPHKKGGKRTSKKTDSCANSETSSQAEEHLKSPVAESLDGSCSSSSGDPGERVRQLSGQSTSSETGCKGPSSEKPLSPVQLWQNEPQSKTPVKEMESVLESTDPLQEMPKSSEKSVGVIVSMEAMTSRSEKTTDEIPVPPVDEVETVSQPDVTEVTKEDKVRDCSASQNGEQSVADSSSASAASTRIEDSKSPVGSGFGFKEGSTGSRNASTLPQNPKNLETGGFSGQGDRKTGAGRSDKFPSLLQEVLQGHHQQERRYARSTQDPPTVTGSAEVSLRPHVLMSQASQLPNSSTHGKTLAPHLETPHWGSWDRKLTSEVRQINLADYPISRKFEVDQPVPCHESGPSERRSVICDISPLRQLVRDPASSHHIGSGQERPHDARPGQSVILPSGLMSLDVKTNSQTGTPKVDDTEASQMHRKRTGEHCMPYSTKDSTRGNASPRAMTYDPNQDYSSHNSRASHPKRGTGRVGSRGRSHAQTQDLSDKLKMSPGRSRVTTDVHHINPTMSLSERASREAFYSAFFQNTDSASLGFHANCRSSSYGEPVPAFNSPVHYKRQVYQQDEYKEWLGNSAQAILSASQHRQEMQRKSPRQESFNVRSPGRSDNEGLSYNQPGSYHDPSNMDLSRQLRIGDGGLTNLATLELKCSSQKTLPCESSNWNLGQQSSPVTKIGSPMATSQKPFSPIREPDTHASSRPGESAELSKAGVSGQRPDEQSHHNPLIMRRRVRSFISPIPSKRQLPDDKGRPANSARELCDKIPISPVLTLRGKESDFSMTEEQSKGGPEERSPPAVSISSPAKTKILPPRKGRGLKLEAIVQKITSPNVRRTVAPITAESTAETVTLDDILSLKGKGPEAGNGSLPESAGLSREVCLDVLCTEDVKGKGLSPKSVETWIIHDDKKIKKEIDEQSLETKDLLQSVPPIQTSSSHCIEGRESSPVLEQKCSVLPMQVREAVDKEKLANPACSVSPKQEVFPPKGYFPSGKKKGRPIGSVNKQKKQQHQSLLLQEQKPQLHLPATPVLTPASPLQLQTVLEQGPETEPKPKRRRREGKKPASTHRRRRAKQAAPIVTPIEPEIKLKYASQTLDKSETKVKSFYPYIHVENKEELGLACVIINAEEEEQRWKKMTSVRKGQRSTSPQPSTESKALPVSSFMVQGPAVTESTAMGPLVCCFCGKWANYRNLGDLFGPFYTQEYASILSKNPPTKKTSETQSKVKVRHKDPSGISKSDSDEEEEEPQQAREQRSLSAHPRYKRRNRSGDCASSRLSVPSRRKTADPCEQNSVDPSGTPGVADGSLEQACQIPHLPLDTNEFWMHEGCVLWANGVYFVCGRLYGLQEAIDIAREMVSSSLETEIYAQ
ncbi:transcription factor 20 isoform X2 [Spea bombifrons]|uniref:transcription factor 20 isoform X2 n=1 Tax=Spea bombifrons TaxID=233779 RepID=UPI00234B76F9|nr:transcription factor 20 isoform X2 [Spea bombifrons]